MTGPSIPDLTLLLGAFASDELPDFALFSCWIQNHMPFFPANEKADLSLLQGGEEGAARIASIKDMQYSLAPSSRKPRKPRGFHFVLACGSGASTTPPVHGYHRGKSLETRLGITPVHSMPRTIIGGPLT